MLILDIDWKKCFFLNFELRKHIQISFEKKKSSCNPHKPTTFKHTPSVRSTLAMLAFTNNASLTGRFAMTMSQRVPGFSG